MLLAVAASMIAAGLQPKIFNSVDTDAMNHWVDTTMARLTLDEKIAQLMVLHLAPSTQPGTLESAKKMVEKYKIGGLLYSGGDILSQARINKEAQALSEIPLLITVDAEWGLSMRLKDAPKFPKNMILGAIDDDRLLY